MKYLLTTIMAIGFAFTGVQAQEASKAPQEKTQSKEEKAAAKAKKEADLMEAFKTAGLTDDEQQKYREIADESSAFGKALNPILKTRQKHIAQLRILTPFLMKRNKL